MPTSVHVFLCFCLCVQTVICQFGSNINFEELNRNRICKPEPPPNEGLISCKISHQHVQPQPQKKHDDDDEDDDFFIQLEATQLQDERYQLTSLTHVVAGDTCNTTDGGMGSCISVFNCLPYYAILRELRKKPAAVGLLKSARCDLESSTVKVCCPRSGIFTALVTPSIQGDTPGSPAPTPTPPKTPLGLNNSAHDYVTSLPEGSECELVQSTYNKVVGGDPAKLGVFPWMALLGYHGKKIGSRVWGCGGSLISSRHVLTAAHCIHNQEALYVVRLGELDLASDNEGATPIDILIKRKIVHEQYNYIAFVNDIGILVLEHDVTFTNLIKPICIPRTTKLRVMTYESYKPMVAGWGRTEHGGPVASHLQLAILPVVSNEKCRQIHDKQIDERMVCVGDIRIDDRPGKDACQGDSGGPLMLPIVNKIAEKLYIYQIGVVSYGKKCNNPSVYTKVTYFVPWIEEKVLGRFW